MILADTTLQPATYGPPPDHLSFGQIRELSTRYARACRRRWAYQRRLGLDSAYAVSPAMKCGRILDEAVQVMLQARLLRWQEEAIQQATQTQLEKGLREAGLPEGYDRIVSEATRAAYEFLTPGPELLSVQAEHRWRIQGPDRAIDVVGYSDWVEADGTITDLKWRGRVPWTEAGEWDEAYLEPIKDQVTTYWIGRAAQSRAVGLPQPPRLGSVVVVSHAKNRKTPVVKRLSFPIERGRIADMIAATREADAAQHATSHPARPGAQCERCEFQERCRLDSERFAPATEAMAW